MGRKWIGLLAFAGLFACQRIQVKADLCQLWRYDLTAVRQEMEAEEASFAETNYMESVMAGLQYARIEFFTNGKLEFRLDSLQQSGQWRLRKGGKELVLRITDQEQVHRVVRLNPDTLVLEPINGQGLPFPRVLVRGNPE